MLMGSDSHLGHRKRVKKKFLENCGADFNDHELLELLLFYSLPRKNTNEIAHTLIERFGSINNVACASVDELKMVEGVGNNSACLLKLVLSLAKRITKDSQESGKRLGTLRELVSYVSSYFMGATSEQTYIVLMDSSLRVIDVRLIAIGSIDEIKPLIRNILELVILKRATAVAIAHNHPRGGT